MKLNAHTSRPFISQSSKGKAKEVQVGKAKLGRICQLTKNSVKAHQSDTKQRPRVAVQTYQKTYTMHCICSASVSARVVIVL